MSDLQEIDEFDTIDSQDSTPAVLPNATGVLVLGILSIVTCWLYGIAGIILGIIALSLHKSDKVLYKTNPAKYQQSYNNSNAGKICAIIGLSLSALFIIYILVVLVIIGTSGGFNYRY